jgi:hypothetical protein
MAMKNEVKSKAGGATDRRSRRGLPTRREVLALIGSGSTLLIAAIPEADPTEIVIIDGWILSPADLTSRA